MHFPGLYEWMLYAHIVLFVYWLGPDWGVYVMGPRVWDAKQSVAERRRWAQTSVQLSQISRNSLILLLPVGATLSSILGIIDFGGIWLPIIWTAALAWVAVSLVMNRNRGNSLGKRMVMIDQGIRYVMIPFLAIVGLMSIVWETPANQGWLGLKLILFAFLLFNSIQQRNVALLWVKKLAVIEKSDDPSEIAASEAVITRTSRRAKFNAYLTWTATLLIAFLGTTKAVS